MLNETKLNEVNNESGERIWRIRDYIQELEDVKDEIIGFLNSDDDIDNSTKNIWISDVKEFYFSTITTWEMLYLTVNGIKNHLDDSKGYLYYAKSRLTKSISQLKIFEEEKNLTELITRAKVAFEKMVREKFSQRWNKLRDLHPSQPGAEILNSLLGMKTLHCSLIDRARYQQKRSA